jgi:hypothetical protein
MKQVIVPILAMENGNSPKEHWCLPMRRFVVRFTEKVKLCRDVVDAT